MTKEEIQIGRVYAAKFGKHMFKVRIDAEHGDGWRGTDIEGGATIDIPSANTLRYEIDIKDGGRAAKGGKEGAAKANARGNAKGKAKAQPNPSAKSSKGGGNPKTKAKGGMTTKAISKRKVGGTKSERNGGEPKKIGCLDAAAKLLGETNVAMDCKQMIEAMAAKGYWESPKGKTPHATLSAAMQREIAAKGKDARFRKTERGKFSLNK